MGVQIPQDNPSETLAAGAGLKERVLKGGAFMAGRQLISMMLSLISVLVITRVIGPEGYGPYAAALGIYQYSLSLGQAGLGVYLVRSKADLHIREFHLVFTLLILFTLVIGAVLIFGADLLGAWVNVDGFAPLLSALTLALLFQNLGLPASAHLERNLDFRKVAMIELSSQLLYYAVALPLVFAGYGAWSLVIGYCLQQAVACVCFYITSQYKPRLAWDKAAVQRILRYTLSYSAANWIWQLRLLVNPLIVGPVLGAAAVGQVGIGIKLLEMLSFVKTIAWRLSVAALAKIQDDKKRLTNAITHGMHLQALALAPILLGFGFVDDYLLPILFGDRWLPVIALYPYLALAYFANAIFNMHSSALYVLQCNWDVGIFHSVHIVIFAGVTALAISRFGLIGYGIGEVAAMLAYVVLHASTKHRIGMPDYRLSALWLVTVGIGLFWRELGVWAIAAPFIGICWPSSLRQLNEYRHLLRRKEQVP